MFMAKYLELYKYSYTDISLRVRYNIEISMVGIWNKWHLINVNMSYNNTCVFSTALHAHFMQIAIHVQITNLHRWFCKKIFPDITETFYIWPFKFKIVTHFNFMPYRYENVFVSYSHQVPYNNNISWSKKYSGIRTQM